MAHSNQVRPREIKESPLGLVRQDKINLNKAHLQFFEKCHWNRRTTSTGNIYKTTSTGNKV